MNGKVVCIGEILWDALPKGIFLGGAPMNVAVNLNNLGVKSSIISAVGDDQLGNMALNHLTRLGADISLVQHNSYPTGLVEVKVNDRGIPAYEFQKDSAWDHILAPDEAVQAVKDVDYIVVGSLAWREKQSADSIRSLITDHKGSAKVIVDVNFRKSFYTKDLILDLLTLGDIAKLNDDELEEIEHWMGWEHHYETSIKRLAKEFDLEAILYTMGEDGSALYKDGEFTVKGRFSVDVQDTVGAGDAFLSGAIFSLLNEYSSEETLTFANAMGAFVAGKDGATPALTFDEISAFIAVKQA